MKLTKTLLKRIILISVAALSVIALVMIPLGSYIAYRTSQPSGGGGGGNPVVRPTIPKLTAIDAELVEGVEYFDNNLAFVSSADITVKATYDDGSTEDVDPSDCTISTPATFAVDGGTIRVGYRGVYDEIEISLIPVELEGLFVSSAPYRIVYQAGTTFDATGMVVVASYNDGSESELDREEYSVDTESALETGDESVSVSYTENEKTAEAEVQISVVETLNDGAVESLAVDGPCTVANGAALSSATIAVRGIYESGNAFPLTAENYVMTADDVTARLGKSYSVDVAYKENPEATLSVPLTVGVRLEGEDGDIVGGHANTETEYVFENGQFVSTETDVSFAGAFANSVKNGSEGSLAFTVDSYSDCTANLTMRCGNSYLVRDDDGYYWMQPLQINTIADLTINGIPVNVANNVVLKGCGPSETTGSSSSDYAPLYGVYYEFTFENVGLSAGSNTIKLSFKNSTEGALTCWSESPSTMNVDYMIVETSGSAVPDDAKIIGIDAAVGAELVYGTAADDVNVQAVAVLDSGHRIALDPADYTAEIVGGDITDGYILFGEYTVRLTLAADESVTADIDLTVEEFESILARTASVEISDDRVYYVFGFDSIGYDEDEFTFFDGTTEYEIAVFEKDMDSVVVKIDVTDLAAGTTIYPHLSLNGTNYANGANANGDIRGDDLVYEDGQSVTLNGKTYAIAEEWSMPTLVITAET